MFVSELCNEYDYITFNQRIRTVDRHKINGVGIMVADLWIMQSIKCYRCLNYFSLHMILLKNIYMHIYIYLHSELAIQICML